MIALDTNILVRFLTQDDPGRLPAVMRLLNKAGETFFISDHVILELHWVLERRYQWSQADIAKALLTLLAIKTTSYEDESSLRRAIAAYARGGDFADEMICDSAVKRGCTSLASFDKRLRNAHAGFAFEPK